jgi:hypothetical protein
MLNSSFGQVSQMGEFIDQFDLRKVGFLSTCEDFRAKYPNFAEVLDKSHDDPSTLSAAENKILGEFYYTLTFNLFPDVWMEHAATLPEPPKTSAEDVRKYCQEVGLPLEETLILILSPKTKTEPEK